ncbi:MAG TPA: hypothetical protein VK121_04500 [Pseudogracilibacillus sp.]|nr:hypothetical protein [Pseudogracilibacillus sp.]
MTKKKINSMQDFEDKLSDFNNKKLTPTSALMNPVHNEGEDEDYQEGKNELSKMIETKKKMEDTHTRRTFLIENELLERLDKKAKSIENKGFKTSFINYILEKGLDELDQLKD